MVVSRRAPAERPGSGGTFLRKIPATRYAAFLTISIIVVISLLALLLFAAGCGGAAATVTSVETHEVTVTQTVAGPERVYTGADTGPVMPNLDAAEVGAVENIAADAYRQQWGDGSGVTFTWGPNIVDDWSLVGLENKSGAAGNDVAW